MAPPLPPLAAHAFTTPPEQRAFALGVLHGMQAAAETIESLAAEELEAHRRSSAASLKDAAEGLRLAIDERVGGMLP